MWTLERYRDELRAEVNRLRAECKLLDEKRQRLEAATEVRYELTDKGQAMLREMIRDRR